MASSYTRRDLVRRSAMLAGAAGAASLAGVPGFENALAAVSGDLSPARRDTYSALVEAVALAGTTGVSDNDLKGTTDDFAGFYARAAAPVRANVDAILDSVETGEGRGFTKMDTRARLKQLRRWHAIDPQKQSSVNGRRWRAVAPVAVELAALPFHPDDAWDRPPVVTLGRA